MSAWYDAASLARDLATKADPARVKTHRIRDDSTEGWTVEARAKAASGARKGRQKAQEGGSKARGAILGPETGGTINGGGNGGTSD